MIGKKVQIREYNPHGGKDREFEGVVLDKIQMIVYEKGDVASGHGGTITINQKFVIDHYLIETNSGIITAKCSSIIKIIL